MLGGRLLGWGRDSRRCPLADEAAGRSSIILAVLALAQEDAPVQAGGGCDRERAVQSHVAGQTHTLEVSHDVIWLRRVLRARGASDGQATASVFARGECARAAGAASAAAVHHKFCVEGCVVAVV